uniref:tRNA wybutosine-synthesizing protein 3 homolog n=1 Tax=Dicentrarchus labrax TaxID=13489 RepID=A0A8C4D754_DICLA
MEKTFSQWKKQCLNKLDLSKKGSVDADIGHVVSLLNSREEYFTTSSCSGRVILLDGHSVAINSGFRNSGLTVSKTGKIISAVRSTHGLEVPLSHEGKLLVEHEYIHFLAQIANEKMEENLRRIHRFYQNLQSALPTEKLQRLQIPDPPVSQELQDPPHRLETEKEKNKTTVYKRRRKREQHQRTDCCHGDGSSSQVPDLDDCLDLFT